MMSDTKSTGKTKEAATPSTPARRKRSRSMSQELRNQVTRLKLIEAAARVIGQYGYAGCTIARVTSRARVAHGTFYLHFESQQDLFNAILPTLGPAMLRFIGESIQGQTDITSMEKRGFEASFAYLADHPYMARVTEEAAHYAPAAYKRHIDDLVASYARSLRRIGEDPWLSRFNAAELKMLAHLLLGARIQLMKYHRQNEDADPSQSSIVDLYLKALRP